MIDTKLQPLLDEIEHTEWATNTTSAGAWTIQQSTRNELSQRAAEALLADLAALYPEAQIVHTADGLVFVVDTEAGPTVSICARLTIKNLDYDPITEAFKYEDQMAERAARKTRIKEERAKREALLAERRKKKLDEIAAKMADKASAE